MSNARFSVIQSQAIGDTRISPTCFRTLAALGMYGDRNGWCFPSQSTLGDILGKTRQAVSKDIQTLKDLGYLEIKEQFREDGSQTSNLYRLVFDNVPQVAGGTTSEVAGVQPLEIAGGATPDVAGGAIAEVAPLTPHINAPVNEKEESIRKSEISTFEPSEPPEEYTKVLGWLEDITGLPCGPGSTKTINAMIEMGAIRADVEAAYIWLREQDKPVRYHNQLIGPTRYNMGKRVEQDGKTNDPGAWKKMLNANGNWYLINTVTGEEKPA